MWSQIVKLSKIIQPVVQNQSIRNFSIFTSPSIFNNNYGLSAFLKPAITTINQERGLKVVGRCRRRCKDCYFVMRQERLYVMCKTHPRHKQMGMKKKPHNTWILTDATQSTKRAW